MLFPPPSPAIYDIATLLEGAAFGFLTCLYGLTLIVYLSNSPADPGQRIAFSIMLNLSTVMFIIATGHIVTSYFMGLYICPVDTLGAWYNVLSNALYIIQELLGTGVAIYRMWIVWNRNWKVTVIPILLLLSGVALGCMPFILHVILPPSELTGRRHLIFTLIAIFSLLIVVLNVICTSLIVYPLLSFHRATSILRKLPKRSSIIPPIIRILIESAMLQLIVELLFLALWLFHHAAQYIVFSLTVPFVGITFTLITLRIKAVSCQIKPANGRLSGLPSFITANFGVMTEQNDCFVLSDRTVIATEEAHLVVAQQAQDSDPSSSNNNNQQP